MEDLIKLINIHKRYQIGKEVGVVALNSINLTIKKGEFVAIMGPSGSGKSTLMNILGCLDKPTSGTYLFENNDIAFLKTDQYADIRNKKIGFVFQNFNLLSKTTALDNVILPLLYNRGNKRLDIERAKEMLRLVGLSDRMYHHPNKLSGGQQQRVAIARALVNKPEIILADEPTGNLDSKTSIEIMGIFQKLNEQGITIILVTHEDDIAHYAKRIITMRDGNIIEEKEVTNRKIII